MSTNKLKEVTIKVASNTKCQEIYNRFGGQKSITNNMLCADEGGSSATCQVSCDYYQP